MPADHAGAASSSLVLAELPRYLSLHACRHLSSLRSTSHNAHTQRSDVSTYAVVHTQ